MSLMDAIRREAAAAPESGIVAVMNHGRRKGGVIPLWAGEGDLPTPDFIRAAARKGLDDGETYYTWQAGIPELREALARYHERHFAGRFAADRFYVTGSGMQSIQLALQATAGAGDEVVYLSPAWPNFAACLGIAGGRPVPVALDFGNRGWRLDVGKLEHAITPKTRALFINTPSNPTGWTADHATLKAILDLARARGLWIIADEIYTHFHYPEAIPGKVGTGFPSGIAKKEEGPSAIPGKVSTGFPSGIAKQEEGPSAIPGKVGSGFPSGIATAREGISRRAPSFMEIMDPDDRIIFVNSFSKNWAMTGWRVGWMTVAPELGPMVENLIQYSTSGVAQFMQRGAVAALDGGDAFIASQVDRARKARDILCARLAATGRVRLSPPEGAFYLFFGVDGISDSFSAAFDIVDRAGVGLAPGTAFGAGGEAFFRICFHRRLDQIEEAAGRLADWIAAPRAHTA